MVNKFVSTTITYLFTPPLPPSPLPPFLLGLAAAPSFPSSVPSHQQHGHPIGSQRDETFAGFTFTDDSMGLMQAGMQVGREGGREGGRGGWEGGK